MIRKHARVVVAASVAASLLVACRSKTEPGGEGASAARDVRIALPQRRDVQRTMQIPGTVIAYYQATLLAQVAGYVKSVAFDKGDPVRAGDLIAEIDVPELMAARGMRAAQVEQARADLERAKAAVTGAVAEERQARANVAHADAIAKLQVSIHERAKALRASGDISVQDLEVAASNAAAAVAEKALAEAKLETASAEITRAKAAVTVARANIEAAESNLEEIEATLTYARIRAPFDGVVTARFIDPGALVQRATRTEAAQPVVTVTTRGRVRLDFELPEGEVAFVHSGSRIEVTSAAYPGRVFDAALTRVAKALHLETRTELCEAELPNEDDALLPGMYVTVRVLLEEHRDALIVPPEAIVERGDETFAFVVEEKTVHRKAVEKGWDFGRFVEVRGGLSARDQVVLGAGDLVEGQDVSPHLSAWSPDAKPRKGAEGPRKRSAEGESP